MRLDKFGNELELLLRLTDNNNYTAQQLADMIHVTDGICIIILSICIRVGLLS